MIFDCNNYTDNDKQKLLNFFKECYEGKNIVTNNSIYTIKELVDITIIPINETNKKMEEQE